MVSTEQPWLDGYCVERGFIRQFVAMPLGSGLSAEEQITGEAEHGGIQIVVYPMKREIFDRRFPKREIEERPIFAKYDSDVCFLLAEPCVADMGLAPGGRMRQNIYKDPDTAIGNQLDTNLSQSPPIYKQNKLFYFLGVISKFILILLIEISIERRNDKEYAGSCFSVISVFFFRWLGNIQSPSESH